MPQVDSVDYPNKRIYLHFDTVTSGVDPVEVYKEVRALRRTNESDRKFLPIITSQGNEPKGGGAFTPRRAVLLDGARLVPYDTSHTLRILVEVITDDEQSGAGAFDRLPLSPGTEVDIDIAYQQVEIREVAVSGSTLTAADIWTYATRSLTTLPPGSATQLSIDALAAQVAAILTDTNQLQRLATADEQIRPTRYKKLDPDTGEVLLDKIVADDGSGTIDVEDAP